MEVWKDYMIEDAIIIGKAVKTVKPKAINFITEEKRTYIN